MCVYLPNFIIQARPELHSSSPVSVSICTFYAIVTSSFSLFQVSIYTSQWKAVFFCRSSKFLFANFSYIPSIIQPRLYFVIIYAHQLCFSFAILFIYHFYPGFHHTHHTFFAFYILPPYIIIIVCAHTLS